MKTIDLNSWDKFEKSLPSFFSQVAKFREKKEFVRVSAPLFRGHSNASWKLQTTLERFSDQTFNTFNYYRTISAVRPAVISITGKEWNIPKFEEDNVEPLVTGYEFMVYLRHHGFPSPLLDWTRSPYVAAFFAFRSQQMPKNGKVAIYAYVEHPCKGRLQKEGSPILYGLGAYVESHKRHYAQQCQYTVCLKQVEKGYVYCSHESAFANNGSEQGELTKFTLPASERRSVLKKLHRMNVTAFSLFGSEESLMETLAYQEIEDKH